MTSARPWRRQRPGWALLPLLTATMTGTMANTVVNVPMAAILRDLDAPLHRGILVSTAFTVTLATLMPVAGWLGDRLGRRQVLCAAMLVMAAGSAGAAFAQSLPQLVACRLLQGLATAPVLPGVMALVVDTLGPGRRGRALGLWAAANGAGQALGPTLGGLLAGWAGWRSVFWPIVPLCLLVFAGVLLLVERDRPVVAQPLDGLGALLLTGGAGLLLCAITVVPTAGVSSPMVWCVAVAGLVALAFFVQVEKGRAQAFLCPAHVLEVRYVRSASAAAAQMFGLGTTLLAAPLYLIQVRGTPPALAGLVVLALPLTMAALAPVSGLASERFGGRRVMRSGMAVLVVGLVGLALVAGLGGGRLAMLWAMVVVGAGVAFVQTPAATGASRSRAGQYGAGLGLFNLIRFGGTALGTACVALLGSQANQLAAAFAVCAVLMSLSLAATFVGGDPSQTLVRRAGREQQASAHG